MIADKRKRRNRLSNEHVTSCYTFRSTPESLPVGPRQGRATATARLTRSVRRWKNTIFSSRYVGWNEWTRHGFPIVYLHGCHIVIWPAIPVGLDRSYPFVFYNRFHVIYSRILFDTLETALGLTVTVNSACISLYSNF